MNGRRLANRVFEWLRANLVTQAELERMTAQELLDKLNEDKY
jgi:hypothetical protein